MKRALAYAVYGAALGFAAWGAGVIVRGPLADESIPKDFATGAAILGSAAALKWAARELDREPVTA